MTIIPLVAGGPHRAYLIDRDGTIVTRQDWYAPPAMAEAISGLLGGS